MMTTIFSQYLDLIWLSGEWITLAKDECSVIWLLINNCSKSEQNLSYVCIKITFTDWHKLDILYQVFKEELSFIVTYWYIYNVPIKNFKMYTVHDEFCFLMLCLLTTEQWAVEGDVHTAYREAGGPEETPPSNRRDSIHWSGATPGQRPHHRLYPNHTSLKHCGISISDWRVNTATSLGIFNVVTFPSLFVVWFCLFRRLSLRGSSSSDSLVQQPNIFLRGGCHSFS